MAIVGGLDVHRQQITFDYLDTDSGQVSAGQIPAADRHQLAGWLARRFGDRDDRGQIEFSVEGCTGWRYVAEELTAAGMVAHLAEPAETARRAVAAAIAARPLTSPPARRVGPDRAQAEEPSAPASHKPCPLATEGRCR